jgi:alpha-tubulin suppressor-like RCC1 family protein
VTKAILSNEEWRVKSRLRLMLPLTRLLPFSMMLTGILLLVPASTALAQKVAEISASQSHVLALREDGSVWTWGERLDRITSFGAVGSESGPQRIDGIPNAVVAIAAGSRHSAALLSDGRVVTWGLSESGALGRSAAAYLSPPDLVPDLPPIVKLSAGSSETVAIDVAGRVWRWGYHAARTPKVFLSQKKFTAISSSFYHSLALAEDGTVFAWGTNYDGQLGNGSNVESQEAIKVEGISNIVEISAGITLSLARDRDGRVFAWGRNGGAFGNGSDADSLVPVLAFINPKLTAIAAGGGFSLLMTDSGQLLGTGEKYLETFAGYKPPFRNFPKVPTAAVRADIVRKFSLSPDGHIVTLNAAGDVSVSGSNQNGQAGNGEIVFRGVITKVRDFSEPGSIHAGGVFSVVHSPRRSGWAWGWNNAKQFGIVTDGNESAPVETPLLGGYEKIALGSEHLVGIDSGGSVWTQGAMYQGSYTWGAPPRREQSAPQSAVISASADLTLAVSSIDGKVWGQGSNRNGCLSSDSGISQFTSIFLTGLPRVREVAAGTSHCAAISTDGVLYLWGSVSGVKGFSGDANKFVEPTRIENSERAKSVGVGANFTVVLKEDGTIWTIGLESVSKLVQEYRTPLVTELSVNGRVALVKDLNGGVWIFGKGQSGPVKLPFVLAATEPGAISVGAKHFLIRSKSGIVFGSGSNERWQLGVRGPQWNDAGLKPVADLMSPGNVRGSYPVTEYFNDRIKNAAGQTGPGHYFITNGIGESQAVDRGDAGAGWGRTGRAWRAWRNLEEVPSELKPSTSPVYRFYAGGPNSHFYTGNESEKDALLAANPTKDVAKGWAYEGPVFYSLKPVTNTANNCPASSYPVHRAFNNRGTGNGPGLNDANHRITSNYIDILRGTRFFGWAYEGVAFCAPKATIPGGDLHAYHTFPGDQVIGGAPLVSEHFFNNAGPGDAHGTTIHAALDHKVNWKITCTAQFGAVCPTPSKLDNTYSNDDAREGLTVATFPAGGLITLKATATAPNQTMELIFASAAAEPSGAPDPHPPNNISADLSKTAVLATTDCGVSLSVSSLSASAGATTSNVNLKAPTGCAWTITNVPAWATVSPTSGNGNTQLTISVNVNADKDASGTPITRTATLTATATTAAATNNTSSSKTQTLTLVQTASPVTNSAGTNAPCASINLQRSSEQQGPNTISGVITVSAPTTGCTWTASSNQPWLLLTQGASGRGTQSIYYTILANANATQRTASLTINAAQTVSKVFEVVQAGTATLNEQGGGAGDGGGDGGTGASSSGDSSGDGDGNRKQPDAAK